MLGAQIRHTKKRRIQRSIHTRRLLIQSLITGNSFMSSQSYFQIYSNTNLPER